MENPTLDPLLAVCADYARDRLIKDRNRELMPVVLLETATEIKFCFCVWRSDFEKQVIISQVKNESHAMNATAAAFVSEGWYTVQKLGQPMTVRPMDDPNRKECVQALATDGVTWSGRRWLIVRNEIGRIKDLIELDGELRSFSPLLDGIIKTGRA